MNTYQLLSQTYLLVGLKQTKKITITQTCFAAVDTEAVFLTDEALGQAQALGNNFAGIWLGGSTLLGTADGTGHRVNHDRRCFVHTMAGHKLGT